MLTELRSLYRESWRYALACPIVFLVPVVTETAQHIVEYAAGFYVDIAHARRIEASPLRLGFGIIKVVAVLLTGYWTVRWLEWHDAARVQARDRLAERRFLPLFVTMLVIQLVGLWLIYGGAARPSPGTLLTAIIIPLILGVLFSTWQSDAPLGRTGGPLASVRTVLPVLPWAVMFTLLASIPMTALHTGLGYGAIAGGDNMKLFCLVVDTLLVGYLASLIMGAPWYIAAHARAYAVRREQDA